MWGGAGDVWGVGYWVRCECVRCVCVGGCVCVCVCVSGEEGGGVLQKHQVVYESLEAQSN